MTIPSDEDNKNGYRIVIEPFKFNYLFRNTCFANFTEINIPIILNNTDNKIVGNIRKLNPNNFTKNLKDDYFTLNLPQEASSLQKLALIASMMYIDDLLIRDNTPFDE